MLNSSDHHVYPENQLSLLVVCWLSGTKDSLLLFTPRYSLFCLKCKIPEKKGEVPSAEDKIGKIKTTKSEFSSLGPDAWWMHERCMTPEDWSKIVRFQVRGGY